VIFTVIAAIIAAVVTASADLSSVASLDVSRVKAGEVWRLFSGHVAHLTWRQYAIDAPAFILLYSTYSKRAGLYSAAFLSFFAALFVSIVVIIAGTHQVYGGFSGLSCAAASAIILAMIMDQPRHVTPYVMCSIYCAYLLFMGGIASGVRVAQEAHVAGAMSGVVYVLLRGRLLKLIDSYQLSGRLGKMSHLAQQNSKDVGL
jgi:membrane associated rhomboid family serine protease